MPLRLSADLFYLILTKEVGIVKSTFQQFLQEERGDIVQYMLLLALCGVILAYAAPFIKSKVKDTTIKAGDSMTDAFS